MDSDADHPGIAAARRTASRRALLREARGALGAGQARAEVEPLVAAARQLVAASGSEAERADGAHSLASFFVAIGDDVAAEPHAREAIAAEREAGRAALLGNHLMFLSQLLARRGQIPEALGCAEEGATLYEATYGAEHGETRYVRSVLEALRRR